MFVLTRVSAYLLTKTLAVLGKAASQHVLLRVRGLRLRVGKYYSFSLPSVLAALSLFSGRSSRE